MVDGIMEVYESIEIEDNDPKFKCLSNYNKFSGAKAQGQISMEYKDILCLLKYEHTHLNRPFMIDRLLSLAFTDYKEKLRCTMQ